MTLGERLKYSRTMKGLSAEQIAENLGTSPATIYRYENGDIAKMPAKFIEPLSEMLSVSPAYLMGWSNEPYDLLAKDERHLVTLYRGADDRARADAVRTLEEHQIAKDDTP